MITKLMIGFLLGYLIGGIATWRYSRNKTKPEAICIQRKFLMYMLITFLTLLTAYYQYPFWLLIIVVIGLGLYEIISTRSQSPLYNRSSITIYLLIATGFLLFSLNCKPELIMLTYVVVISLDGFSQVAGQLFGKTKLAPTISPNKTVEGLTGGLFFGCIGYLLLAGLQVEIEKLYALLLIMLSGLSGDLLASLYKRRVGIKDFSRLIPYHGGVLDRFDSFMMAGCTSYVLFIFGVTI
jgi:phosphatidate cytidylyltransferase